MRGAVALRAVFFSPAAGQCISREIPDATVDRTGELYVFNENVRGRTSIRVNELGTPVHADGGLVVYCLPTRDDLRQAHCVLLEAMEHRLSNVRAQLGMLGDAHV